MEPKILAFNASLRNGRWGRVFFRDIICLQNLVSTNAEFESIIHAPPKQAKDYPSHYFLFQTLQKYKNIFRRIAISA